MKTARVVTGSENGRGASMMMSKGSMLAELKRSKESKTQVNLEEEKQSPCPINRVDKNIYIGNEMGAQHLEYLVNNGITHILNTAIEIPNYYTNKFIYLNLQLADNPIRGEENLLIVLEPTYQKILEIINKNPKSKIFIHCAAGISRSASITIYYLMKKYSMSFENALEQLRKVRKIVNPNDWYKSQLKDAQLQIENEGGVVL